MLKRTWSILASRPGPLLGLAALTNGPVYALDGLLRAAWRLSPQESAMMSGVLGIVLLPLAHGGLVHLADGALARRPARLFASLGVARRAWRRVMVAYMTATLVFIGWAAVCVLPGALILLALGLHQDERNVLPFALPALAVVTRFLFLDSLTVLEGLEPHAARRRSAELAKGQHVRLAAYAAATLLPLALLENFAPALGDLAAGEGSLASIVVSSALAAAAGILSVVPVVLFYVIYKETTSPGVTLSEAPVIALRRAKEGS